MVFIIKINVNNIKQTQSECPFNAKSCIICHGKVGENIYNDK